jgi:hypothetical protein
MNQVNLSQALAEALIGIDPLKVTHYIGKPIEDLMVDMLRDGMFEEVRGAILQAQKAWGTLPEQAVPRKDQRFIEHINPFLRFLQEGDSQFLKSVKNHFFGLSGAGLNLDVPEKRYKVDTYYRYRYALPMDVAIEHHGKDFPVFNCASKTQLSQFCRLFGDKTGTKHDLYAFTRDLDFDYKNFHVWGSASELDYYQLRDNLVISAGMGGGLVTADTNPLTNDLDSKLIKRQEVLWKALCHRADGVAVLNSIINQNLRPFFNNKPITAIAGARFFWELMPRIADVLSANLKINRNEVVKTLLIKGLEIQWGGQDFGFEASTTQWVELDAILPLIKPMDRERVSSRLEGAGNKLGDQLAGLLEEDLGL